MIQVIKYLLIITLVCCLFIILKPKKLKYKTPKLAICIMIFLAIAILPFENLILKFDTPESAFKYTTYNCEIVKIVEKSKTALIIYKKNNTLKTTIAYKVDQKWKLSFLPNDTSLLRFDKDVVVIIREEKSNNFYIVLSVNTDAKHVSDNINSVFQQVFSNDIRNYYVTYVENYNGEYIVDVNGNKYQII